MLPFYVSHTIGSERLPFVMTTFGMLFMMPLVWISLVLVVWILKKKIRRRAPGRLVPVLGHILGKATV